MRFSREPATPVRTAIGAPTETTRSQAIQSTAGAPGQARRRRGGRATPVRPAIGAPTETTRSQAIQSTAVAPVQARSQTGMKSAPPGALAVSLCQKRSPLLRTAIGASGGAGG